MIFKVILEPSAEGGYTVTVPSLPACISEDETIDEAMVNIKDAIELFLEPIDDSNPEKDGVVVKELIEFLN